MLYASALSDGVHNLMAMESQASNDGMNIVSGVDTSQKRVVELVIEACKSNLKPEHYDDPTKLKTVSKKQGFSREKAKRLIGWEPQVSIGEGIGRVVAWFDKQRSSSNPK